MPRAWTLLCLLGLMAAMMGTAAWSEQSQPIPREEQQEDDAILQDLEIVRELEMLELFDLLQYMEMLGDMDSSQPRESLTEERDR